MNTDFRIKGTSNIWHSLNSSNKDKLVRSNQHAQNSTKYPVSIVVTGKAADGKTISSLNTDHSIENVYHKDTNRPKGGLGDVEIRIGDQFGMLLKATVNFTIYDINEFKEIEKVFLRPNTKVNIDIEYIDGSPWDTKFDLNKSGVSEHKSLHLIDLTIFKFKFSNTATNTFDCSFECMGSSNMIGKGTDIFSVLDVGPDVNAIKKSNEFTRLETFYSYRIATPIGLIFYNILRDNRLDAAAFNTSTNKPSVYYPGNLLTATGDVKFTQTQISAIEKLTANHSSMEAIVVYPKMPMSSYIGNARLSWWQQFITNNENTGIYITLGYLVNVLINTFILPKALSLVSTTRHAVLRDAIISGLGSLNVKPTDSTTLNVQYICDNKHLRGHYFPYLCSGDPMKVVWLTTPSTQNPELNLGQYTQQNAAIGYDFNVTDASAANNLKFNSGADWVDLTKILINVDEIARIFDTARAAMESKDTHTKIDQNDTRGVVLSVHDFLNKIFALIKSASGGLYDIEIVPWPYYSEAENVFTSRLYLVNKKYIDGASSDFKPVLFNPLNGDDITISATTDMDIPNDAIAMNAYAEHINNTTADAISPDDKDDLVEKHKKAIQSLIIAKTRTVPADNFSPDSIDELRSAVTDYVNTIPKPVIMKNSNVVYPLKLNIECDGINGFRFGDLVGLDHINTLSGYEDTVFRLLAVVHTISNNSWVSKLESVCDLNPKSDLIKSYSDYDFGEFAAVAPQLTAINTNPNPLGHQ